MNSKTWEPFGCVMGMVYRETQQLFFDLFYFRDLFDVEPFLALPSSWCLFLDFVAFHSPVYTESQIEGK